MQRCEYGGAAFACPFWRNPAEEDRSTTEAHGNADTRAAQNGPGSQAQGDFGPAQSMRPDVDARVGERNGLVVANAKRATWPPCRSRLRYGPRRPEACTVSSRFGLTETGGTCQAGHGSIFAPPPIRAGAGAMRRPVGPGGVRGNPGACVA